jgi:hypothetical protein
MIFRNSSSGKQRVEVSAGGCFYRPQPMSWHTKQAQCRIHAIKARSALRDTIGPQRFLLSEMTECVTPWYIIFGWTDISYLKLVMEPSCVSS